MGKEAILKKAEENKNLVVFKDVNAVALLKSPGLDKFLVDVRKEVGSIIADVSTEKGRNDINNICKKIAKSKSFVEKIAIDHARDLKAESKLFDSQRKKFKDSLDDLKDETYQPLGEWEKEKEEQKRIIINRINEMDLTFDPVKPVEEYSSTELKQHLDLLQSIIIDSSFGEWTAFAQKTKEDSLLKTEALFARQLKYEQDQDELVRLQKEKEERERLDREEQIRKEAAESAATDERLRIEKEQKQKEDERLEQERKLEAKKSKQAHRAKIHKLAMASLMENSFAQDEARHIVELIKDGKITNICINY